MKVFPVLMALALASAGLVGGCSESAPPTRAATVSRTVEQAGESRVLGTVPRFRFMNQDRQGFGSKELDGKVWIATFIFTRCAGTCPLQTAELVALQEELKDHPAAGDIHFVSISVDPEYDRPKVLKEYAKQWGADPDRWTFLTGKRDAIWDLSKEGFKLPVNDARDNTDMIIAHSQQFVLVDRAGRIRGYYDGLNEVARAKLKKDLELVLQDPPGPVWEPKTPLDHEVMGSRLYVPMELRSSPWMAERAEAQLATRDDFDVFCDFSFSDRRPESGVSFRNRVVDDAGKHYKGVHYDHGNGVIVADVNGDGLLDLYFVTQRGPNQLALNKGGGRFEDATERAGVAVEDRIGVTGSFVDTDNDGDQDLYVTTVRGGNLLFENDGTGVFTDVSARSGLDYSGHSSSAVFFDYDRDGLVDLFLTNVGQYTSDEVGEGGYYVGYKDGFYGHLYPERSEQSILFRNTGGNVFEDVSEQTGLQDLSWSGAATPVDANADGWPDLYVLSMEGHDEYYENVEGKRFVKKSRELFPATPWGAMGVKTFDFDNDGDMDIYVTDMHTDMVDDLLSVRRKWYGEKLRMPKMFPDRFLATDLNHVMGNAFYRNDGGEFTEIAEQIGAENYWPWGLSVGDLNADGYEDVFVASSMNFPFRYGVNSVLLNDHGRMFRDSEFILGVEPRRDGQYATPWFELNCDEAYLEPDELVVAELCTGRTGTVEVWGALGTRSSVIFDLDDDGDLDIVTNEFNSPPMMLISDLARKKPDLRYLKIDLQGTQSNRNGLGATVRVRAGDQDYTKVHDGQTGYLSQSDLPLYFGLADAGQVDSVEVVWPSGATQVIDGPIEVNRTLTVVER